MSKGRCSVWLYLKGAVLCMVKSKEAMLSMVMSKGRCSAWLYLKRAVLCMVISKEAMLWVVISKGVVLWLCLKVKL